MQGTLRKHRFGYEWMRVGFAGARFRVAAFVLFLSVVILLAFWTYVEMPPAPLRLVYFVLLYFAAVLVYLNLGVWVHEQLHCLPYRAPAYRQRTQIVYTRRYLLTLSGYYCVTGPIDYRIVRRALMGPIILVLGWLMLALLASMLLPGWWLPMLLMLAAISLMDMLHDLYWLWQIRPIREKGKYWDNGSELEVVWKA